MHVSSVVCSKGGVGKTTTSANLGGISADAGLKTLLIDLDGQPTLSSYYPLDYRAPGGTFDLLVHSNTDVDQIISRTNIPGLDIILSNDPHSLRQSVGFGAPPLNVVFNRQDNTNDARAITENIRELMNELVTPFHVIDSAIPALLTYRVAASQGVPAHRMEPSNSTRQKGRKAPLAADTLKAVASELWPEWKARFEGV